MCLMCEYYYDLCDKAECVDAATGEEKFISRGGTYKYFLHKGYSGPCRHMIAEHEPDCPVVKKVQSEYGLIYDDCECGE